jgi:hypothetical protein
MQNLLSLTRAHLSHVPADAGFLYESCYPQECQYKKKSVLNWFDCREYFVLSWGLNGIEK